MAAWDNTQTNNEIMTKAEALNYLRELSQAEGYTTYKVFYDGVEVVRPSDLPDLVERTKVSIGPVLNQA